MKFTEYDKKTLNHLQNLELMILKDFVKICDENNLRYYIYGGSLLGAIRHKGFIPWDDDIDIIMFRKDYEQFKKIFLSSNNEKYDLLTHETYEDYFFLFSKLSLKGTKFEEWWVDQVSFHVGINIDIFVLDYVSDNNLKCFFETKVSRILDKLLATSSIKLKGYPFAVQFISNFSNAILNLLKIKPITLIDLCLKLLTKYDDTKRACDISALNHPQVYNVDDFGEGKHIKFENMEINSPINPHNILEQIYGDYMQLPPESERYNHITEELNFGSYELK